MHAIRQLTRQPLKTISGIILITLAVAILCVCLGQALAAYSMQTNLDELCTSVGLFTDKYGFTGTYDYELIDLYYNISYDMPDEVVQWVYDMAKAYPNIIEGINRPGLASAYIPELTADSYTAHLMGMSDTNPYADAISTDRDNTNYTRVMLEITLDEIGQIQGNMVELVGTIESVLSLQDSYADPTGYTARMKLVMPDQASLEALELQVGQRYLVYTMDYHDLDWELRVDIAVNGHGVSSFGIAQENPQIDYFDLDNWKPFPDGYVEDMGWVDNYELGLIGYYNVGWYEFDQALSSGDSVLRGIHLTNLDMLKFRTVRFTMYDLSAMDPEISETYSNPTIVKLDGTAEEFLASEEGTLWQEYLEYSRINIQSFAVVGVDDLMATGDFAVEEAAITSGRNFTEEELVSGAKVCVISEEVATLSGLRVGDTITLNYYNYDYSDPYQNFISEGRGTANPTPYAYGVNTEFTGAGERYTIVGLYSRGLLWEGNTSAYNFTVNTVFAPKTSITGEMDYGETGIFLSVVIRNGAMDDFEALAARDGYDGLFECTDQGYETIKENLYDYGTIAQQAAVVGVVVYAIIMLLFLLLYPAMQGKTLSTMGSMGASRLEKTAYMMSHCWGILIPGTVLGVILGMLLWGGITSTLAQSARVTLELEMDLLAIGGIAVIQLFVVSVLAFVIVIPMTRNKSLMNKQGFIKGFFLKLQRTPLAGWSIVVFAVIIAVVLCALHAANQREYDNYEIAVQEATVTVTLVNPVINDPFNLNASGFVSDLFYEDRFSSFTPMQYLTDFQYMTSLTADTINGYEDTVTLLCVQSVEMLPSDSEIHWLDSFDRSAFDSEELFLLAPDSQILIDMDPHTDGIQVILQDTEMNQAYVTVIGTYAGGNGSRIYANVSGMKAYCERTAINYTSLIQFQLIMHQSTYETLIGITSNAAPPNLTAQRNCEITWYEGFDASCLDSEEEMFLLVPEGRSLIDMDDETPGTQVILDFSGMVFDGYYDRSDGALAGETKYREMNFECIATVAGTYTNSIDSQDIYCSMEPLATCCVRIGNVVTLNHISATLINNDEMDDLREMCDQWFRDPDRPDMIPSKYKGYMLVINDETLENLSVTLENSIAINELCTLLVFIMSAGAGFFLGFLMIRSRKREIILMRTLGKANYSIYIQYAIEQMLCIAGGTALGGLVFAWQPLERLAIFVAIYFVGLSAALILFLNSKLLTTIKEEE